MEVKIEKLIYGGEGLAHHDGSTVFVPYVLPEEVVRVREIERKKKFVRGRVQQMVTPSSQRATAPCPHFMTCGGCHYQHIPYDAQLTYKSAILRETLSRLGRLAWEGPIHAHPSPPYGYRNRAQWKIRAIGAQPAIGYFQSASTALCPVEQCPILSPRLEAVLSSLRALLAKNALPATLREVEAFIDAADDKVMLNVALESFSNSPAALAAQLREEVPGAETILLNDMSRERFELFGPGHLNYRVGDTTYRVGHLSFFQSNRFLLDDFVHCVVADAQGKLALDLFAGVGLFTIPLARHFERVVAVESNAAAARDLDANIAAAGVSAQTANAPIEKLLHDWQETPDFVVLDPPRAGVPAEAVQCIVALAPPRVRYVSCDPATLARDLQGFLAGGFHIEEIHLFDMFPQTFHIETLVKLVPTASRKDLVAQALLPAH
ncbi:MAG TPA: 23S rRNA (uracil(1939)-C(5))-methyltransferase RlmD [Candidatus Acidoferrales bacterium]|nr:23S rRNA (uracil(1939)-C(5))-methyltransferase RlmD [Candidatus Acidoferrales bacterium]